MAKNYDNEADEEMLVDIYLDDGTTVTCSIITIFEYKDKDYIALLPLDENSEVLDGEPWFYGYEEDMDDLDKEPVIIPITDEDELDAVADTFDEMLDKAEFDEIVELDAEEWDVEASDEN